MNAFEVWDGQIVLGWLSGVGPDGIATRGLLFGRQLRGVGVGVNARNGDLFFVNHRR
jgi:hypothetical protein